MLNYRNCRRQKKKEKERNSCAFKPKPNVVLKKPQRCFYSICHVETEHHVLEVLVDMHNVLLACHSQLHFRNEGIYLFYLKDFVAFQG